MSIDIRLPNITAVDPGDQVAQIRAYLYQFAGELQWALNTLDTAVEGKANMEEDLTPAARAARKESAAVENFSSIKSLIIKSADIVEAYYEKIDSLLELSHKYTSASEFGSYTEEASQKISANSQAIEQQITNTQTLQGLVGELEGMVFSQQSYIRYGAVGSTLADSELANENAPGIEIGDYTRLEDGTVETTNQRFARFTAYGLELFGDDKEAGPVAYIKQRRLYITEAEITYSIKIGGFLFSAADGMSIDWAGG